ncbi:putative uncharacterized protein [Vibrio anguillarum]|nr:putative uncharacterized protein [Vibrio anguillarum]CDQ48514.1 putative uncharacterized protein [Vibrio anguillarum]
MGDIQAYPVPYVAQNISLDAHYSAESASITKEYCPTSFRLSLPFWPQRINHFRCFII